MAAGFTPRKIEIERDLATESWRIYGFDREGERRVMHVPAYQAEEMFDDRMQAQTEYYLQKAQHKMQADMEREMANVWSNNTFNTFTTTGTATSNTTTDYFVWNQDNQLRQLEAERARLQQQQYFVTKSNGIGLGGGGLAAKRKPKDFREELQQELDDYLKDVLH